MSALVLNGKELSKKIKKPTLKMRIFKIVKKIPGLTWLEKIVKKHVGSTDYRNASDTMRKILVRHVNLDLTDDLSKVKCPTLLIWGTNDTQVDYEDAVKSLKITDDGIDVKKKQRNNNHLLYDLFLLKHCCCNPID